MRGSITPGPLTFKCWLQAKNATTRRRWYFHICNQAEPMMTSLSDSCLTEEAIRDTVMASMAEDQTLENISHY